MSSLTLAAYKIFIEAVDRFEEKSSNMKIAENVLENSRGGNNKSFKPAQPLWILSGTRGNWAGRRPWWGVDGSPLHIRALIYEYAKFQLDILLKFGSRLLPIPLHIGVLILNKQYQLDISTRAS